MLLGEHLVPVKPAADPCSRQMGTLGQAGVGEAQALPDSFRVQRATGQESPQRIYLTRDLDLDAWQLAQHVRGIRHLARVHVLARLQILPVHQRL